MFHVRALILTAGFVFYTCGGSVAQLVLDKNSETAEHFGLRVLDDPTAFRILEALTTEIGARPNGSPALDNATSWAQRELVAAGLQNVHREEFATRAWIRGAETAQIVWPSPQNLVIAALGGSVATPSEGIDAEVVLFRNYSELLGASPGALAGKIVVVTQRINRTRDGSGYANGFEIRRNGASEAAKRGAVGFLLRSLGTDSHRLAHAGATSYARDAQRIPAAALSNPDADQLERLCAIGPVRIHLMLAPIVRDNARSWNLVGEVPGRERPDEIVLIGAHLDSWDLGTGAVDDGAGVAAVIAAAKSIAGLPTRPKRTVRIVLFGAEEMDFSGPAYEKAHANETSKIMIAGEADFGARPVFAAWLPAGAKHASFMTELVEALRPLKVSVGGHPADQGGSDIDELHADGVPIVSIRQDGSDYFDIHHTADDTLDKIDPRQLAQNAAVWAVFTELAANSDYNFRNK